MDIESLHKHMNEHGTNMASLTTYLTENGIDLTSVKNYIKENGLDTALASPEKLLEYATDQIYAYRRLMAYYNCAMMEIETKFKVINESFSCQYERNPIESIKTRLKSMSSIKEKLERRHKPFTAASVEENLFDVAGVRVICSFVDDVYKVADALVRQDDILRIERTDYIENPKENGYRSLHLIVQVPIFLANEKRMMNVEIQLRTIAMDFWASLEHQLRYKKDNLITDTMAQDLKNCATISTDLDNMMNALCNRIYEDGHGKGL